MNMIKIYRIKFSKNLGNYIYWWISKIKSLFFKGLLNRKHLINLSEKRQAFSWLIAISNENDLCKQSTIKAWCLRAEWWQKGGINWHRDCFSPSNPTGDRIFQPNPIREQAHLLGFRNALGHSNWIAIHHGNKGRFRSPHCWLDDQLHAPLLLKLVKTAQTGDRIEVGASLFYLGTAKIILKGSKRAEGWLSQ